MTLRRYGEPIAAASTGGAGPMAGRFSARYIASLPSAGAPSLVNDPGAVAASVVGLLAGLALAIGVSGSGDTSDSVAAAAPVEPVLAASPEPSNDEAPEDAGWRAAVVGPDIEADAAPPMLAPRPHPRTRPALRFAGPITRVPATQRTETEAISAPWRRNAVAAPADAAGRPVLAIVIDDLGDDVAVAEALLELDAPITLAILPHRSASAEIADAARRADREVLVHVPMEPIGTEDPGPNPISTEVDATENLRRLDAHLAAFDGFVGVNNHMGSAATANAEVMRVLLRALQERGLLFLDSRTASDSWGWRLARRAGMPSAANQVFLDNDRDVAAIRSRLDDAVENARVFGASVAIGHPSPEMLFALRRWLARDRPDDVALTPITTVALRLMAE